MECHEDSDIVNLVRKVMVCMDLFQVEVALELWVRPDFFKSLINEYVKQVNEAGINL